MKKAYLILACSAFLSLTSCALKAIPSEYSYIKTDLTKVDINDLGNGSVLIYNGANILHKLDNTARLNVWIDNKPLGQIRPSEYLIINMENKKHVIKLLHIDVVNMRSEHDVIVTNETKIIRVKPTLTSNKLEVTNEFPNNFEKFKYVPKR